MPMTTRIWCSISRIVVPRSSRRDRMNAVIWAVSAGFMPAVGSSSRRSLGCVARALAISRRRWSPYGRLSPRTSPLPPTGPPAPQPPPLAGKPDDPEQPSSLIVRGHLLRPNAGRVEDGADPAAVEPEVLTDEDVLDRGHLREQADVLVGPGDAAGRNNISAMRARP